MKDVAEQRTRFVVAASRREKPMVQLCQEFEISRPTGYGWLKRYQQQGVAGLKELSRRPHHSPNQMQAEIQQRVVELRQQRPDWGARKLQVLLEREGVKLPVSSIHRTFVEERSGTRLRSSGDSAEAL
jgi:transposase